MHTPGVSSSSELLKKVCQDKTRSIYQQDYVPPVQGSIKIIQSCFYFFIRKVSGVEHCFACRTKKAMRYFIHLFTSFLFISRCVLFRKRLRRLGTRPAKITALFTIFPSEIEKMLCIKERYSVNINEMKIRTIHSAASTMTVNYNCLQQAD